MDEFLMQFTLQKHLQKNLHSLFVNWMGNQSSWKPKSLHPRSNKMIISQPDQFLSLCRAVRRQDKVLVWVTLSATQPLRVRHSKATPGNNFLSTSFSFFLSFSPAWVFAWFHCTAWLYQRGAELIDMPRAGERSGCLSWCCCQQKCLKPGPSNQVKCFLSACAKQCLLLFSRYLCLCKIDKHFSSGLFSPYLQHLMWSCCFHAPKPPSTWLIHTGWAPALPNQRHVAPQHEKQTQTEQRREVVTGTAALLRVCIPAIEVPVSLFLAFLSFSLLPPFLRWLA